MKRKIALFISLLLICSFSLVGCGIGRENFLSSSENNTSQGENSFSGKYKNFTFENMSIDIPKSWSEKDDHPNYCFYDQHDDMFLINIDDLEDSSFGNLFFEYYKENTSNSIKNYNEILSESYLVGNELAYHYEYTGMMKDQECYMNSYLVYYGNKLYILSFVSQGTKQCSEFDDEELMMIISVKFNISSNNKSKSITDSPTEAPTTEEETEEPTTQMTDALHELYNDDRITLSFYQIHDYEYDPNESRIEFWAENKTDKNLTIQSDLVSVNGISYKGNMSGQVLPHTKGIIEMRFDQKIPVDMPSSIGMKISYFDGILGDTIDENEIVIPETKIQ